MGKIVLVVMAALAMTACGSATTGDDGGDTGGQPEMSVTAFWKATDTIEVDVATDLPDGARLTFWAVNHDRLDTDAPLDAADTGGDLGDGPQNVATVTDGQAQMSLDVSHFEGDAAVVEVSFLPNFEGQPDAVADAYAPNEGVDWSAVVER